MATDLIGRWGVCSIGRLGKITGLKALEWGVSYVGTGIDGTPWSSRKPTLISVEEGILLDEKLEKAWMYEDLQK